MVANWSVLGDPTGTFVNGFVDFGLDILLTLGFDLVLTVKRDTQG